MEEIAGVSSGAAKIPERVGGFFVERVDFADVLCVGRVERDDVAQMDVGLDA